MIGAHGRVPVPRSPFVDWRGVDMYADPARSAARWHGDDAIRRRRHFRDQAYVDIVEHPVRVLGQMDREPLAEVAPNGRVRADIAAQQPSASGSGSREGSGSRLW